MSNVQTYTLPQKKRNFNLYPLGFNFWLEALVHVEELYKSS